LYATAAPTGTSVPVSVFLAYSVIGFALEMALTNRTVACEKSMVAGKLSSTTNPSTVLVVVL
jgi:hypothetical protein